MKHTANATHAVLNRKYLPRFGQKIELWSKSEVKIEGWNIISGMFSFIWL